MFRFVTIFTALVSYGFMTVGPPAYAQDKAAKREAACAVLGTKAEIEICLDRDLTRRDAYLNEVYQQLKKKLSAADFKALRQEQREWLKERNRCSGNVQCLKDAYMDRLAILEQNLESLEYPNKSHVEIGCGENQKFVDGECVNSNGRAVTGGGTTENSETSLESQMIWQSHRISEPDNRQSFRRAVLSYGVPETDAVLFETSCDAGKTTTSANTILGYNPSLGRNGDPVAINLVSGHYNNVLTGEIYGVGNTVEGLAGLLIKPAFNNAFWTVLSTGVALTYGVKGDQSITLSLRSRGSNGAVRKFLKDCVLLGANTKKSAANNRGSVRATTASGKLTCDDWDKVRSDKSGAPVTIKFVNKSDGYRAILWINKDGTPIDRSGLNTGESYTAKTQHGHIWMFTDGPGNCIEMYAAQSGTKVFHITTPSPIFGPEND